jgi:hypothetical protein
MESRVRLDDDADFHWSPTTHGPSDLTGQITCQNLADISPVSNSRHLSRPADSGGLESHWRRQVRRTRNVRGPSTARARAIMVTSS